MNAALITARTGSESLPGKNLYPIGGKPIIAWQIEAAKAAKCISTVYVDTNGQGVGRVARHYGARVLSRSDDLARSDSDHGDTIKQSVERIDHRHKGALRNVAMLLGNAAMVSGALIDKCLMILDARPDLDSVITVWRAADDHPLRAMDLSDGVLRPYGGVERKGKSNRQAYPAAYFYDQGVMAFRKECVRRHDGPMPWWWMGKRCYPLVRPWMAGRDLHGEIDIWMAEQWVKSGVKRFL